MGFCLSKNFHFNFMCVCWNFVPVRNVPLDYSIILYTRCVSTHSHTFTHAHREFYHEIRFRCKITHTQNTEEDAHMLLPNLYTTSRCRCRCSCFCLIFGGHKAQDGTLASTVWPKRTLSSVSERCASGQGDIIMSGIRNFQMSNVLFGF